MLGEFHLNFKKSALIGSVQELPLPRPSSGSSRSPQSHLPWLPSPLCFRHFKLQEEMVIMVALSLPNNTCSTKSVSCILNTSKPALFSLYLLICFYIPFCILLIQMCFLWTCFVRFEPKNVNGPNTAAMAETFQTSGYVLSGFYHYSQRRSLRDVEQLTRGHVASKQRRLDLNP